MSEDTLFEICPYLRPIIDTIRIHAGQGYFACLPSEGCANWLWERCGPDDPRVTLWLEMDLETGEPLMGTFDGAEDEDGNNGPADGPYGHEPTVPLADDCARWFATRAGLINTRGPC